VLTRHAQRFEAEPRPSVTMFTIAVGGRQSTFKGTNAVLNCPTGHERMMNGLTMKG
jgi:hypothetical protein